MNIEDYYLIGIGEFSHGIQESWVLRFNLLKQVMKTTNKNITIFSETSIWQGNNITNKTNSDIILLNFDNVDNEKIYFFDEKLGLFFFYKRVYG